ncbi:MAG: hypothetical protein KUG77_22370 [Nannocystaceae bacterium]|nr:hypothetical protein [Nannocystaceae bacterium]
MHGSVRHILGAALLLTACGDDGEAADTDTDTAGNGTTSDATASGSGTPSAPGSTDTGATTNPPDSTTDAPTTAPETTETTASDPTTESTGESDPARSCAGHDYLLCLDFEDDELGGIPADWTRNGDLIGVQDDFAHLGTKSLRTDAQPEWRRRIEHDASMIGAAHWGRVFYRVEQPIPDAGLVHSTHVSLTGVGPNVGEAEYRYFDSIKASSTGQGIENRLQFIFNVQPSGPEFAQGTGWIERYYEDQWHCAEWHVDAADQSYAFYYDGEELFSFVNGPGNFAESEIPDSYSTITLGWTNYQTAPPGFTAWYDDFAIDDERIGCGD